MTLHEQFRTKIELGIELIEAAIAYKLRYSLLLFDGWYLAEEPIQVAKRRKKDWISILKKNRNLVTNRVDWNAQKIIATYLLRWPIETYYQDGKEQLGLDEYDGPAD